MNTASPDQQGYLLFVDEKLVGVVARIERHEDLDKTLWGRWCLEAAFGLCHRAGGTLTFATPEDALEWAVQRVDMHERNRLSPSKAA
ncbi:hypothetical protein [Methylobacterium tarhaniae]|uniref:hypothetical protein n=1 Tax=Methylobacterium tarhaniae TaxID=1187852 RepID=UPI003D05352A